MDLGQLNLTLSADGSPIQNALKQVRGEAQDTANAISNMFAGAFSTTAVITFSQAFATGVANDIDKVNQGLSVTDLLLGNLEKGFQAVGKIGILELGNIAAFLKEDLFEGSLAGVQQGLLEDVGLGQLDQLYGLASGAENAVKLATPALQAITFGIEAIDSALASLQGKASAASNFFFTIGSNAGMVKDVLQALANGIDQGIQQIINHLKSLSPAFATVVNALESAGIEFKLGRQILGDYIDSAENVEKSASGMSHALGQTASAVGSARTGLGMGRAALNDFSEEARQGQSALGSFRAGMEDLAEAGQLFSIWKQASDAFDSVFGSLEQNFNAAKATQNLTSQLQTFSTSAGGAGEDLAYLNKLTSDLGINFDATAKGYSQFSVAASQANFTSEKTKEVFSDVAQAAAVMRLSADDTQGVFLALRQSLSGGNVQLEELNQLSERLPGAFQAAAAALGVTTSEVKSLISTGKVASEDFIPKFAAQLASTSQGGVVGASQGAEAAVNRFSNSLGSLQSQMGQAWVDVGTPALNLLSSALDVATQNEELFSTTIDAILIASIFRAIPALINFAGGFSVIKDKVFSNVGTLKSFAIQMAVAYAAIEVFYRIMDRVKNGAGEFNTSIKSIEASLAELDGSASKAADALKNALPEEPPPTDWLDSIVVKMNEIDHAVNKFVGLPENFGDITTNAQKQLDDVRVAVGDLADANGRVITSVRDMRVEFQKMGGGPIAEIKSLDNQLKELEKRKLTVDPKDKEAVKALAEEEKKLLQQKAEAQKKIMAAQSALNNSIQQTEQRLKAIDPAKVGVKAANELKGRLQQQLDELNKEKTAFDEVANAAQKISDSFEKSNTKLEQDFTNTRASIAEAQAKGQLTEEQAQAKSLESEKKYLADKLKLNQDKAAEIRTELERNAKMKLIDPKAAMSADNEKKLQDQLQQLDQQTAQTRIEIAQKTVQEKKASEEQILKDFQEANAKAEATIQQTETAKITAIKQRQLAGKLTEEQSAAEIETIRSNSVKQEIDAIKTQLTEVGQLKKNGTLSTEEATKKESELNQKLADSNLKLIEQELKAREEAKRKQVQAVKDLNEQAQAAIQDAEKNKILAIKQQQADGILSEQETQSQIEDIKAETIDKEIQAEQDKMTRYRELRAKGVIDAKEFGKQELDSSSRIKDLKIQQVEAEVKAREEANQRILQGIEEANKQAETAIKQSTQNRIIAIKQLQLQRQISEEEATRRIEQINNEASQKEIQLIQQKLAQISQLKAQGVLSDKAATEQQTQLQTQLGELNLQRLDQELVKHKQVQDEKIRGIEQESEARKRQLDIDQMANDEIANARKSQLDLLNAQLGLVTALGSLEEQRIQIRIDEAKSDTEKLQLEKQLGETREKNLLNSQEIQRRSFELSESQNAIEAYRNILTAQAAELEAEVALIKAKSLNASQKEIESLEKILSIRKNITGQMSAAYEQQDKIRDINREAMLADQQKEREKLQAENKKQKEQTQSGAGGISGGSAGSGKGGSSWADSVVVGSKEWDQREQARRTFAQIQQGGGKDSDFLRAATSLKDNPFFSQMLQGNGLGQIAELSNQFRNLDPIQMAQSQMKSQLGGKDVLTELQKLNQNITGLASRPSTLTVTSASPTKDAADIYSNLSRNAVRSSNL